MSSGRESLPDLSVEAVTDVDRHDVSRRHDEERLDVRVEAVVTRRRIVEQRPADVEVELVERQGDPTERAHRRRELVRGLEHQCVAAAVEDRRTALAEARAHECSNRRRGRAAPASEERQWPVDAKIRTCRHCCSSEAGAAPSGGSSIRGHELRESRASIFDGCGHALMLEAPDERGRRCARSRLSDAPRLQLGRSAGRCSTIRGRVTTASTRTSTLLLVVAPGDVGARVDSP